MNLLSYIIWNGNPEIFTIPIPFLDTELTLRWYGLLFALGFLISQQILYYIFKKEGKPEKDVDTLTIYMVIATVIGARLGHVLFYEPERYLSNPIDIFKIWEGGLASHGAGLGIFFALWLYCNFDISLTKTDVDLKAKEKGNTGKVEKKVKFGFFINRRKLMGQSYMQTLDRIAILVALTGALIRLGNFYNSEIIGEPTHSDYGVVFTRNVSEILKTDESVKSVRYVKQDSSINAEGFVPIKILVEFEKSEANTYEEYAQYLEGRVNNFMSYNPYVREHIHQDGPIDYKLGQDESGQYFAIINTHAISRYPAQLYESISCILLFALLFWIWNKHKEKLAEGRLFGIFLMVCFGLRFMYEFLKENQVDFENSLPINMGQILSVPFVIWGAYLFIQSYRKKSQSN